MAIPWLYYGYTMALLWLYYGYTMAILWLYYGYTVAILWLYYGRLARSDDGEEPLAQLEQPGVRDTRRVGVGRRRGALRVR